MTRKLLLLCLLFVFVQSQAKQLAFPGADGFGRFACGGRGGEIYHVTSLNDSGPGTLRDAVSKTHRIVVFDRSGVIRLKSRLLIRSNITLLGQTAPGDGVVVYGNGVSMTGAHDVIIRFLRFRGSINMGRGVCTMSADQAQDIIFDHVSIEWGRWDNLHIKESDRVTVQYCLIGAGIDPQKFGALLENPVNLSIHHCLWVNNQSRNPKAKAAIEVVNNVIYNWGSNGLVGGHSAADHYQDIISNYFIAGPNSSQAFIGMFSATDHVFQQGNKVDLNKDGMLNAVLVTDSDFIRIGAGVVAVRQHPSTSRIETADQAFAVVLSQCGDVLHRDHIDKKLIDDVKSLGKKGQIIKNEDVVGGQPAIVVSQVGRDSDSDGIPDVWEKQHGLNPADGTDAVRIGSDGYSNVERYAESLLATPGK